MIGWRPYLFTALALVLLAVMVLDVTAATRPKPAPDPCAVVNALAAVGFHREALVQYEHVLEANPTTRCPAAGQIDPAVTP